MLPRNYDGQNCSVARALELVGERWSLLIVRDTCRGISRFDELERSIGIPRSVLAARLDRLGQCGILERRRYQTRPERFEYVPTERGYDLFPVIAALMKWGDRHAAPDGPPIVFEHADCGGEVAESLTCLVCGGDHLRAQDVTAHPGPGASAEQPSQASPA